MNLIEDYRNPKHILALAKLIEKELEDELNIMEICGGHTHTIMKFALPDILPQGINFIHGPGCPVCVIPKHRIDHAIELACMPDTILATLGDMLRVPGSKTSLAKLRANGKEIKALYSPQDVIKIAQQNPSKNVIFFAIGFETTTPMSAAVLTMASNLGLKNLFFHINHVVVPEPVSALMQDKSVKINAFLGPSHVSVITGYKIYEPIANEFKTPISVSGFEPSDVLEAILNLVRQKKNKTYEVHNQYKRAVSRDGNTKAQELVNTYFKRRNFHWRGLGEIAQSGLELKEEFSEFDAEIKFDSFLPKEIVADNKACICGEILKGKAKPNDCKVFAKVCNPQNPLGSCMVSSEGACSAYYKFKRQVS